MRRGRHPANMRAAFRATGETLLILTCVGAILGASFGPPWLALTVVLVTVLGLLGVFWWAAYRQAKARGDAASAGKSSDNVTAK